MKRHSLHTGIACQYKDPSSNSWKPKNIHIAHVMYIKLQFTSEGEHFQAGKIIIILVKLTHDDLPTCTHLRSAGCRRGGLTSWLPAFYETWLSWTIICRTSDNELTNMSLTLHVQYFDTSSFEIFWPKFEWLSDKKIYGHISFEQKNGRFCIPCIVKAERRWFCRDEQ